MEFFNNLTATGIFKQPPTMSGTVSASAVNIPINTRPTAGFERPTRININMNGDTSDRPSNGQNDLGNPPVNLRSETETVSYGGGGGGFSFGAEEEVVPETTEVVQNKSNIGKTILILTALGLGLWLLSGGKKIKVK